MSKKQHIGSHTQHSHPDGQMRPRAWNRLTHRVAVKDWSGPTSRQRELLQRVSTRKRRQRDRLIEVDE